MMYLNLLLLCLYSLSGKSSESIIFKNNNLRSNNSNFSNIDLNEPSFCYYPTILIHGIASNKNELNEFETSLYDRISKDGCEDNNVYNLEYTKRLAHNML